MAQVYVSDKHARVPRPAKELKGFERVMLKPGETKHVTVALDGRSFAYYDTDGKSWRVDPGKFSILVGNSSEDVPLDATIDISESASKSAVE